MIKVFAIPQGKKGRAKMIKETAPAITWSQRSSLQQEVLAKSKTGSLSLQ
jgi:hypothetical protein